MPSSATLLLPDFLPAPVATTLRRIGGAALPVGLMAVGAGLRFGGLKPRPVSRRRSSRPAMPCCRRSRSG